MTVLITEAELQERFADWRYGQLYAAEVLSHAHEFDEAVKDVRVFVESKRTADYRSIGRKVITLSSASSFPGFYPWTDTNVSQSEVATLITKAARLIYAKQPAKEYA